MNVANKMGMVSTALLLTILSALTSACAPQTFEPTAPTSLSQPDEVTPTPVDPPVQLEPPRENEIASHFFRVSDSQAMLQQDVLDQNQTSLTFKVQLPDGSYLHDLKSTDLKIRENGVEIPNFKLSSNSEKIVQTVDIVFAVDVTGSMAPTIESAKTRLIQFVKASRTRGYRTRMCVITFGDETLQHCNKFYDNNPADPETEKQVQQLISDISKLRAIRGENDPGGHDQNENAMRAVIDASEAPFDRNSQRFLILVTDDGFLYSPENPGAVGPLAPKYQHVLRALQTSQMQVFAATPPLPGFNQPFKDSLNPSGVPSIVKASKGQHFPYADLVSGKITLDTILNGIMAQVKTHYLAEYIVDEVPGLIPSLPVEKRKFEITLANGQTANVTVINTQTNLPTGRPEYKKRWRLGEKNIRPNSLVVRVNGIALHFGYRVEKGELVFDIAPPRGARIEVVYRHADLKDSLMFTPIVLNQNVDLNAITVFFNGKKAMGPDVAFEKTLEGNWSLRPSEKALSESDPFEIHKQGGLSIKVVRSSAAGR